MWKYSSFMGHVGISKHDMHLSPIDVDGSYVGGKNNCDLW